MYGKKKSRSLFLLKNRRISGKESFEYKVLLKKLVQKKGLKK